MAEFNPETVRHIALVSISAPPKAGAESIQCAKWIRAFHSAGMDVTLITTPVARRGWASRDPQLDEFNSYISNRIERDAHTSALLFRLAKRWPAFTNRPDENFLFARDPARVVRKLKRKADLIYARGMPFSSALLAARLSEYLRVPLIIHMADPFSQNPYLRKSQLTYATAYEKYCFNQAALVAFTTEQTASMYRELFPQLAHKIRVYPNVFDDADCKTANVLPEKFTLRYTGNLYAERSLDPLFKALMTLASREKDFSNDAELVINGRIDPDNQEMIRKNNLDMIKVDRALPYFESLSAQSSSHLLISTDRPARDKRDLVFLPSKLLDYMCAGRRILNIASAKSESASFVTSNRVGQNFEHEDIDGMTAFIMSAYKKFKKGEGNFFIIDGRSVKYQSANVMKRMLKDLEGLS